MDTGFNDLKYFPEEELENIIAEVRKKRQQKWENHLASKSLALGSSNIDQMMEIFQSERKNNSEVVAEVSSNIHDIERTDYCQCRDNGCECIKDKIVKDCDIDEKRSPIKEKKTATSSKNKIKRIHEDTDNEEAKIYLNCDETKLCEAHEPTHSDIYPIEEECDVISTSEQEIYEELNTNQEIFTTENDSNFSRIDSLIINRLEVDDAVEFGKVIGKQDVTFEERLELINPTNYQNCSKVESLSEINSEAQFRVEIPVIDKDHPKPASKQYNKALLLPEEILFRLRNILKRLVTSLEQFKKHITKQKNDEEDEDNERKMKRANEFVSWFSRNYLYQLKRQACLKSSAHSSIAPCKKIDEFLKETMALYDYCIEELKPSPELEKMKSLTNEACKLLEEHVQALEKAEAAVRAKAQHKKRTVKQPKSNVPKKLSMYCSSSLPKECWEKKSSKLARKKFGPPKPKNAPAKSSKVSPKPSERSLGDKQEKLPLRGNGKMGFGSESEKLKSNQIDEFEKLKMNQIEDALAMVKHDSVLDSKSLQTVIENEINDEEDLAIPLLLPCDSGKRFELFLLANTMTELEKLRGKMDKEEGANNGSNEETVKETLQKIAKQINEIYKSSSDFNENLLDKNAPEDKGDVANSKLICMKHDENYQKKQRKIEYNKDGIISEDGKSLCIPFCIDDETIESCKRYRCEFEEYKNSLCCDPDGFLNLVERSADSVILKLIDSIAEEMEEGMSLLTNKLYELELKEVCS
ncbi:uncharacterized protein LOC111044833 isoform X2 [Nilaparvata lugens]|uniref:uncharacterized protein LOC111044833 isoform X2 n=1 Tax=Nilaparvata lugens TaxID=108931 RepID=UPI00193CA504|nr:uncharacterized protein LOC111044833 isoform X2 [Nilaparvata lugens]